MLEAFHTAEARFHGEERSAAPAEAAQATITPSAGNKTVALSGTGTAPTNGLTLRQTAFSFPATPGGTTSATTGVITLKSTGTAAVTISKITDSDLTNFPLTTTWPSSLSPGSSCTITIQFKP